jgi:hypothetical protein
LASGAKAFNLLTFVLMSRCLPSSVWVCKSDAMPPTRGRTWLKVVVQSILKIKMQCAWLRPYRSWSRPWFRISVQTWLVPDEAEARRKAGCRFHLLVLWRGLD